jgi:hypothetical protein
MIATMSLLVRDQIDHYFDMYLSSYTAIKSGKIKLHSKAIML